MVALTAGQPGRLSALAATRRRLGGATRGPLLLHCNSVASTRQRIEAARGERSTCATAASRDRFGAVPGVTAFIPLPAD